MRKNSPATGIFFLLLLLPCSALPAAGSRAERTLRLCDDVSDPSGLDPHFAFDNKTDNILNQIYEGLVRFDASGRIAPSLAERWESADENSIRFFLRKNVKFHNGEAFDARAVEASLKRQLSVNSPLTAQIAGIKEVLAESRDVVLIRTHQPDALLLRRLAAFGRIIAPSLAGEKTPLPPGATPAGTGPFRFSSWERGKRIILAGNPDSWRGPPSFDLVFFEFIPEDRQIESLIQNKVDLLTEVPGTRTMAIAKVQGLRIVKAKTLSTHAFWFTSLQGPLADVRVRQALNLAIDKNELVRYAALGNGTPIATLSMPGEVGYNPSLVPYPYDPPRARLLMKEAGYKNGFKLRLLAVQQSERDAKIIQAKLRKIGVSAELSVVPIGEGFRIISEGKLREYDIHANLAPDPIGHVGFLAGVCFSSSSPMSAGGVPGFDERYQELLRTVEPERHARMAEDLDRWVHDQALGIFTYQRIRTYGVRGEIRIEPSVTGMLDLAQVAEPNP